MYAQMWALCMYQNDVLTELCTRELKCRGELNRMPNVADPAILLAPMEPGKIRRAASPVAVPAPPAPAPAKAEVPAEGAAPAPVAPVASPARQPQQQPKQQIADRQKRAQQYTACLQQAGKDYPRGSPDLMKAVTACIQMLQAQ
jgi:hypothetical protein